MQLLHEPCYFAIRNPVQTLGLALATVLGFALAAVAQAAVKNVVIVHGAFADGSGWKPVAEILRRDGYSVYIVQEPETTFEDDVAATRLVLDMSGPCVLVGHSYGGMIITEAGIHPAVKSLVYVAAFQPAVGESAASLNSRMPAASNSIVPFGDGFVRVKPDAFQEDFAADLPRRTAQFMAVSQVLISLEAFGARATATAWSRKPSYAVVAKEDRMINPDLERFMTRRAKSDTIELPGSHAIYQSHSREIAALIEKAAKAVPGS